jgi:hypothetical protein
VDEQLQLCGSRSDGEGDDDAYGDGDNDVDDEENFENEICVIV